MAVERCQQLKRPTIERLTAVETATAHDRTAHWTSFETTSLLSLDIRQNVPSMLVDRAAVRDKVSTVLSYVER